MSIGSYPSWLNATFDGVMAVGTIAVAILAIWGERLRSFFVPLRLTIRGHNLTGVLTHIGTGQAAYYYHLKVVNEKRIRAAKSCRLMLVGAHRQTAQGTYAPVSLPVPLQFVWAPAGFTPTLATVERDQTVDFGFVLAPAQNNAPVFQPALYIIPNDFDGLVRPGQTVRYSLDIEAEGFVSETSYVYEVSWEGGWSDEPSTMAQSLKIREVIPPAA
jgi:hypothetical protein